VTEERLTVLDALLEAERARPLAGVVQASNRTASPFSQALQAGAENLLGKAWRAVQAGDRGRAERYVRQAVRLPFDDHEEGHPAWNQASVLLYTEVSDVLEESALDDPGWLDAALAVLTEVEPETQAEGGFRAQQLFRYLLMAIDNAYQLRPGERRRLRAALGGVPWSADRTPPAPEAEEEHVQAILQVLDLVEAYHGQLA
jgi:hypothetical protein